MVQKKENSILIHACCGICSAYPIFLLKEMGFLPVVYFANSNIDTQEEFLRRLEAQKTVCAYHQVELLVEDYDHNEYLQEIAGLENEPERGSRCDKCIEFRLSQTAKKAKELGFAKFTTSLPISPHKNFQKIAEIGVSLSRGIEFVPIDFKKKDGFLKTNHIARELGIYRQNYCGCEFAKSHLKRG